MINIEGADAEAYFPIKLFCFANDGKKMIYGLNDLQIIVN